MNIKKHIPNTLTLLNLLSGSLGIIIIFESNWWMAAYFIWLAALFDFFDGFAARLLKVSSAIGKELDSLADMVSFGLLPAFLIYKMMQMGGAWNYLSYLAFLIALFSALRLAKFNIDTRQTDSFIGLPTPANAFLISSFPLIYHFHPYWQELLLNTWFLVAITIIFSGLLVAEIHLMALKFKSFKWSANKLKYIFLVTSAILLILIQYIAIPVIIVMYILFSLVENQKS
ncbi:MAG: CDP-diacylglycerol--serine O-phosphatidyltransferase [Candidatus Cyclobacteriaceae bacterium M3_2C_046]